MGSESIASIAELASTAATDVGMHGLLASQSCTILCYPLVYVHCGPVVDFFITKQTSLHPFDFVRNLFHLLYYDWWRHCSKGIRNQENHCHKVGEIVGNGFVWT